MKFSLKFLDLSSNLNCINYRQNYIFRKHLYLRGLFFFPLFLEVYFIDDRLDTSSTVDQT